MTQRGPSGGHYLVRDPIVSDPTNFPFHGVMTAKEGPHEVETRDRESIAQVCPSVVESEPSVSSSKPRMRVGPIQFSRTGLVTLPPTVVGSDRVCARTKRTVRSELWIAHREGGEGSGRRTDRIHYTSDGSAILGKRSFVNLGLVDSVSPLLFVLLNGGLMVERLTDDKAVNPFVAKWSQGMGSRSNRQRRETQVMCFLFFGCVFSPLCCSQKRRRTSRTPSGFCA
jgi:hypothetical protein